MEICAFSVDDVWDGVGKALDATERLLRIAQGLLILPSAAPLKQLLVGVAFGRDLIFFVSPIRDTWEVVKGDVSAPSNMEKIKYANMWLMDVSCSWMFLQDWTPLKIDFLAPFCERVSSISWVSYYGFDVVVKAKKDGAFENVGLYKSLADLAFASTATWLPRTTAHAIAAITSGGLGLRQVLA